MFTAVHNNGSLYNSTNHRMELTEHRGRDASFERALVGTGLYEPIPDYASIAEYASTAESMGVTGYGPVEDQTNRIGTERGVGDRQEWEIGAR
jgi:acetolactate synthase-1/2/3 large subunit